MLPRATDALDDGQGRTPPAGTHLQTTRRRRLALRRVRTMDKGRRNETEMQEYKIGGALTAGDVSEMEDAAKKCMETIRSACLKICPIQHVDAEPCKGCALTPAFAQAKVLQQNAADWLWKNNYGYEFKEYEGPAVESFRAIGVLPKPEGGAR
jgi:hypothetical protein